MPFVISHNLHRRHLTESQRGLIAGRLANVSPNTRPTPSGDGFVTIDRAAEMLNVSKKTVERGRRVAQKACPSSRRGRPESEDFNQRGCRDRHPPARGAAPPAFGTSGTRRQRRAPEWHAEAAQRACPATKRHAGEGCPVITRRREPRTAGQPQPTRPQRCPRHRSVTCRNCRSSSWRTHSGSDTSQAYIERQQGQGL